MKAKGYIKTPQSINCRISIPKETLVLLSLHDAHPKRTYFIFANRGCLNVRVKECIQKDESICSVFRSNQSCDDYAFTDRKGNHIRTIRENIIYC